MSDSKTEEFLTELEGRKDVYESEYEVRTFIVDHDQTYDNRKHLVTVSYDKESESFSVEAWFSDVRLTRKLLDYASLLAKQGSDAP